MAEAQALAQDPNESQGAEVLTPEGPEDRLKLHCMATLGIDYWAADNYENFHAMPTNLLIFLDAGNGSCHIAVSSVRHAFGTTFF